MGDKTIAFRSGEAKAILVDYSVSPPLETRISIDRVASEVASGLAMIYGGEYKVYIRKAKEASRRMTKEEVLIREIESLASEGHSVDEIAKELEGKMNALAVIGAVDLFKPIIEDRVAKAKKEIGDDS